MTRKSYLVPTAAECRPGCTDPIHKNQSKFVDAAGILRYSADGSEVFPGPTGVRKTRCAGAE